EALKGFPESSQVIELCSLPVIIVIGLIRGGGGVFVVRVSSRRHGPADPRQTQDKYALFRVHSPLPGVPFTVTIIAMPRFSEEAGPKTVIWEEAMNSFSLKYLTRASSRKRPRSISES